MTVNTTTITSGPYTATSGQTIFDYTFRADAATDLDVYVNEILRADYTVLDLGEDAGGQIEFNSGLTVGDEVYIRSSREATQDTEFSSQGGFYPEEHERAFDKLTYLIQQLGDKIKRTLRIADTKSELPVVNLTAGKYLQVNGTADGFQMADSPSYQIHDDVIVATYADIALTTLAVNQIISTRGHTLPGVGSLSFIGKAGSVTNNGGTQINSATVDVYADAILGDFLSSEYFGSIADGSDETAEVQAALDAMSGRIYLLKIPVGTKFNLANLTFPAHCTIEFSAGDDISNPSPASDIGSGERVYFNNHSDYPADPSGGIVDEWRMTGALNPAVIVDVRKTIPGADAGLGPGQDRLEPARASIALHDDQTDNFLLQWQHYKTFSYFSGIQMHGWRRIFQLNGIGTAQWSSVPAFGTTITGTTSGAIGHVISVDASKTTVVWFSGRFVAGETVSDNNETTVATISSAVFSNTPMPRIHQGFHRGNWGIGLPAESASRRPLLAVGGMIGVQATRTSGQYVDETIVDPGYEFCDSYEAVTPNGYKIVYDASTGTAANRRLYVRSLTGSTNLALVGSTKAAVLFAHSATVSAGSFNVATVTPNGTGTYDVVFTTPMVSANYIISIGNSTFNDRSVYTNKTVNGFTIINVNPLTNVVTNLNGIVDILCSLGDV
jgi:hypothetical protein